MIWKGRLHTVPQLDGSIDLGAKLAVVHYLEERVLLRSRDETRPAQAILPDHGDFSREAFARGRGLKRRISVGVAGVHERHQDACSPDTQISDRNRTI